MTTPVACQIALKSIDLDHLEDVEDNLEAVQFTAHLSQAPTETWISEFHQAYKQMDYILKPPVEITGDAMQIIYLPRYAPELQSYFDFLKEVIECANTEAHRTEDIHKAHVQDSRKGQLRDALAKVRL